MKKNIIKNDDISESLIKSILFFILGIILATKPNEVVTVTLYVLAAFFCILGVIKLITYYRNPLNKNAVITGTAYMIFSIAIAIFTYALFDIVETVLRYTIAIFLVYTVIVRVIKSFSVHGKVKLLYIINSLITVIFAIVIATISSLPLRLLGIIIAIYGIVEIISYIYYKKEAKEYIKEAKIIEK